MNAMSTGDVPTICGTMYGSVTSVPDTILYFSGDRDDREASEFVRKLQQQNPIEEIQIMANNAPARRIVQVFIADPNENVPLEHAVLYKGDQKLTDLTDTELFFETPINDCLKSHNDKRVKWLDKEASKKAGKDIPLDPVKIRELKMVVVTIAQF